MSKKKGMSRQHSFRLSLDNPKHMEVHRTLMDLNRDIYRSRSSFIADALYDKIHGAESERLTNAGKREYEQRNGAVTRNEIDIIKKEIENHVLKEMTSFMLSAIAIINRSSGAAEPDRVQTGKNSGGTQEDIMEEGDIDPSILEMIDRCSNM